MPTPPSSPASPSWRVFLLAAWAAFLTIQAGTLVKADEKSATTPVPKSAAANPPEFHRDVLPFLEKHCTSCHGDTKPKGGVNLVRFKDAAVVDQNRKSWRRVLENVESGDMPPDGKPKPSADELAAFMAWSGDRAEQLDCAKEVDPGRVTLRRLNRAEYNNTIRDLVGIDFHPADDFPSDDVGYGFDNIGDVLSLPPLLLEKYMAAAEQIAERAIDSGTALAPESKTWEVEELPAEAGGSPYSEFARVLGSTGEIAVSYNFPRDAVYILRARAFGQQAGPDPARAAFKVDGKEIQAVDVPATEAAPGVYEVRTRVAAGTHRFSIAFLNDFWDPNHPDPNNRDRNFVIDYLEIQGPVAGTTGKVPDSHRKIIFRTPTPETRGDCAREIIDRFVTRAYRRPATDGEVGRLIKFVDLAEQNGDSFERGIQLVVQAVLVSPQFLFRVEMDKRLKKTDKVKENSHLVNDYELATRLSYFLWSTMPDDELFTLAASNKLHEPAVLEKQVRRMLTDPKAKSLVENFADQWLQIRNLKTINPDRERFPTFDDSLRGAMLQETELFFEAIMREDRSVLDFLDADFSFVNERLAKHYGLDSIAGEEFRRVTFEPKHHRGGVLTHASVLAVTSNPTRTSPVKRGKWILEQVLGTPPPPPPPNVPELKDEKGSKLAGTLRQRMEQHRANPSCASCHAKMDPLGFGFENYDAVGAWREKDEAFAIDPSGVLPSGQTFQGPEGLKSILKTREKEFTRCLSEKMMTFALGRGVEEFDQCVLDRIVDAMVRDHYRFSTLVIEIVKSEPFQRRRNRRA